MNSGKKIGVLQTLVMLLSLWLINQLANSYRVQIDLTEEKRYTISEATKKLLRNLDEEVYFEFFLAGDLPSNFERFQKAIDAMLAQFTLESENKVKYKFTDPTQATNRQARNQFYQS